MDNKPYNEKNYTEINSAKGRLKNEFNLKKQFSSASSLVGHASLPNHKDPYINAARVDTVIKCGGSIGNLNGLFNSEKAQNRIVCALVGLPGRGKTYTANKLSHYLNWLGYSSKVFNVAYYRQKSVGTLGLESHNFFDPANLEAQEQREEAAKHALKDIIRWFESDNKNTVAIYDATNITKKRRKNVLEMLTPEDIDVIFIEIICNDPEIIKNNISDIRVSSPDYKGMDPDKAEDDFNQRIAHYEKVYEPLDLDEEEKLSFIKSTNIRRRVIVNRVDGYIQTRIVYFLMNLHAAPRTIYFTRHGESQFNVQGRIGGDAYLSPRGEMFAKKLPSVFASQIPENQKVTIWTSTLKRTIQTSQYMPYPKVQFKCLDELNSGVCDGFTYEQIEKQYPQDFAERDKDKFNYRYKGGESYRDLVQRLEPIIMELERFHDPDHTIIIIGHQAVIRCIYSYFMNYNHEELPYVKIPLHTLIKVTPKAYNCDVELIPLNIPAVNTQRDRRSKPAMIDEPKSMENQEESVEQTSSMDQSSSMSTSN